jgi:hypothetical protein
MSRVCRGGLAKSRKQPEASRLRKIRYPIAGVTSATLWAILAPTLVFAGPTRATPPHAAQLSSSIERISDRGYQARYYGRSRYGFYAYEYDPGLSILGAELATTATTGLYGYGYAFPAANAHGDPWPYDQRYPFYNDPYASYGYGYGYPIYGGFRHRYWGPGYPAAGGGPEWVRGYAGNGGARWAGWVYRPWGGGFTHRGFDGGAYQAGLRRRH